MMSHKIFVISIVSLVIIFSSQQSVLGYGGPPEQSSANNYAVEIITDNTSYALGDSVVFSGSVNKYDEDRNLRISIFGSGNSLIVSQKTPVNADGTFSHKVLLDKEFSDGGKFIVKSQYGNSKVTIAIISFKIISTSSVSEDDKIPSWIQTSSGFWVDGDSSDTEFINAIEFLIKKGLIKISEIQQDSVSQDGEIPSWIKTTVGFWVDGDSSDTEFINAIEFLIKEGFIKLSK